MGTTKNAIHSIIDLNPDSLIISSAGYISRLLYEINDNPKNFYMMGSMGCTIGFAIGLAMNIDRDVIAIIGDGDAIMGLSSILLTDELKLDNLTIYILDNNQYKSTGGQRTCSKHIPEFGYGIWVIDIEDDDYIPPRIALKPKEIKERFYKEINHEKSIHRNVC